MSSIYTLEELHRVMRQSFPFQPWMGDYPRKCAPWTDAEDKLLKSEYAYGINMTTMKRFHGRDSGGIESRLQRLIPGYLPGWQPTPPLFPPTDESTPVRDIQVFNALDRRLESLFNDIEQMRREINQLRAHRG